MKVLISLFLAMAMYAPAYAEIINVYHTSDVHGWYSPHQVKSNGQDKEIGGFAALSALLKKDTHPYILVDSGDTFQGTPEGNFSKGAATIELMNKLSYSALIPGNHDFDYGEQVLRTMVNNAEFPVLGANLYVKEQKGNKGFFGSIIGKFKKSAKKNVDFLSPYTIMEVNGHKIAILGILGTHTATSTLPTNVKQFEFGNEKKETKKWIRKIMKKNPDAIIVLAHIGLGGPFGGKRVDVTKEQMLPEMTKYGTLALARAATKTPTVVFGGHNHTGLNNGFYDEESGVLLAESSSGLTNVSKVELDFDDTTGKLKSAKATLLPLWVDETGTDEEITAIIKKYKDEADKEMEKQISTCDVDLTRSSKENTLDTPAGNWFADAMARQANAQIGVQNSGGVRSDIAKGIVKNRDIYQIMPFDNTLVTLTLSGEQVVRMVEDNIKVKGPSISSRLQVSGIKATFKVENEKITDLKVYYNGNPIDTKAMYTIATNNYLTTGGTGGKVLMEAKDIVDTATPLRDILIKDIQENPVTALPEGDRLTKID